MVMNKSFCSMRISFYKGGMSFWLQTIETQSQEVTSSDVKTPSLLLQPVLGKQMQNSTSPDHNFFK